MYKSVISILALMSFASCAMDHEIVSTEQERKPIALTSVTKAAEGKATTPFNSGDVWLWAKKSDETEYIKAWHLNANGSGDFTSSNGTEYYWPSDGSSLTFYALHGNFKNSTEISEGTPSWADLSLTHTVESDQSTDANRFTSDLLYAKTGPVASNTTPAKLTFEHLLAKITVKLDMGNSLGVESADLNDATISVTNILPDAVFSSSNGTAENGSGEKTTIIAGKITTTLSGVTEIGSAIVPPQSFGNNENANKIQITLSDGRIFSYTPNATNLEKNKEYTYTLKIINSELSISSITVNTFTENPENMSWDIYLGELNASGITVNDIEETEENKSWDIYVSSE